MRFLQLFILTALFSAISLTAFAQEPRSYGLIFDPKAYNSLPLFTNPSKGERSIGNYSLERDFTPFTPTVMNQGEAQSCLFWASLYYAYTIQRAIQENRKDRAYLAEIPLSPMYLFKQLKGNNCQEGLALDTSVTRFMTQQGHLKFSDLPTSSCAINITAELKKRAALYLPIAGCDRLFADDATPLERRMAILEAIDKQNRPVVVGMKVYDNFETLKETDDYYRPSRKFLRNRHAITVVGYSMTKSAFKLVNSWGKSWAKGGFVWMKFDDFDRDVEGAIALVLPDAPRTALDKTIEVGGDMGFQYLDTQTEKFKQELPFHKANGIYELKKRNWPVGQLFQLLTNNAKSGQAVCVFSIDSQNKLTLHWPYNEVELAARASNPSFGMGIMDRMPTKNYKMIIPASDKAMVIEKAGVDHLCVLYSDNSLIQDLPAILERIENSSGDIMTRIKAGLGNRLIAPGNIHYQPSGMSFTAKSPQGDTVPLVLKIESIP